MPRLHADARGCARRRRGRRAALPPFLRIGSWIGSDRDGNPFVTAETLRYAAERQSALVLEHYLDETHELGAELSLCRRARSASTPSSTALAAALAGPLAASRRRALSPRARRHLRPPRGHRDARSGIRSSRPPLGAGRAAVRERRRVSPRDLDVLDRSLRAGGSAAHRRAAGCASLRHAARIFGFHLAPLDLRQHSGMHERVVGELLARAGVEARLRGRSTRRSAGELLLREIASPRPLAARRTSPTAPRSTGRSQRAAGAPRACSGASARAIAELRSSRRPRASATCSRSRCCCKEAGCCRATSRARRSTSCRSSRPSTTCAAAGRSWTELLRAARSTGACSRAAATCRR